VDGNLSPLSDPMVLTTDPADPNDVTPPTTPAKLAAGNAGGFVAVSWTASTDDLAPQSLLRYDVYVNGELRAVVVGGTTVEVEADFGVNEIAVVAVDTADNESAPATITVVV
jgi:hypothetical protein